MANAVKAQRNIEVEYNGIDITANLNSTALDATVNQIDTTTLASDGNEKTPGSTNWSVDVGGNWTKAIDDAVGPDAVSPPDELRTLVVKVGKTGAAVTYTWTNNSFIGNYKIEARDPSGVLTWSGTLAVSGAPVRGTA